MSEVADSTEARSQSLNPLFTEHSNTDKMKKRRTVADWAIPVNKNTPLWRNVDCVRGGLSRPEYLSQGVIYMIDNNYVWGGRGRNISVPGGLSLFITCLAGEEEEIH